MSIVGSFQVSFVLFDFQALEGLQIRGHSCVMESVVDVQSE